MTGDQPPEAVRRPLNLLRVGIAVVALVSLVLGYLGFAHFHTDDDFGHRPIDLLYYSLQLFVLGADPLQSSGPYPRVLELARFTAPAATLYALFEASRLLFTVEWGRWRARHARGHAVVCGDTPFAVSLSRRLRAARTEVIEVRSQFDVVEPGDPLRVVGDARDPRVLRAAGIDRAAAVYVCARGSATNAAIALAARRGRVAGHGRLAVYSHIADPDLCATFQAAFLGQLSGTGVSLDFFNINQIAARRLFDADPVLPVDGRPPVVLIAGTSGFGTAVVVAAARSWRVGRPPGAGRLPITLVGEEATETVDDLTQRYPFLDEVCTFTLHDADLMPLLAAGRIRQAPDRLLVCHRNEEYALKSAMAAERSWRGRLRSAVVRLDTLAALLDGEGAELLDAGLGVVRPFGVVEAACDPALIQEDLVDRLAHVIHERYLQGRRERGEWAPGDPSLEPWEHLSPRLRHANRAQAEDIGHKLAQVRCVISPRFSRDGDAVLEAGELDVLAQREHERWLREQLDAGWTWGPTRSEIDKKHPGLRPWSNLPQHFRNRCHDAVDELTDILADAGFRIVRG